MKTSLWRKFPKWALALSIVVVSTMLFAFWWFFLYPRWNIGSGSSSSPSSVSDPRNAPEPDEWELRREKAETLPDRMGSLVVAGNDLYDIQSGELIFQNWLSGGFPPELFYDSENRKVIGRVPRGLIRYDLTGKKNAVIGEPAGVAFSDGFKVAVFARGGDVWKATPDWNSFSLTKELQVTKGGQFNDSFLSQNIQMGTENMMVVRQPPNLLRVDLNTGEIAPMRLPPGSSFQNQSPDGRMLAGMLRERGGPSFYAYDMEKDNAEPFPLGGRKAINAVLWLGNDRCAVLAGGDTLHLYDRKRNSFDLLTKLVIDCNQMLGPALDGNHFFCGSRRGALLIDVVAKTAELFPHPAENMEWLSNDSLIYACGLPNSALRGTWFLRIGAEPVRITEEPYIFTRDGKMCGAVLKARGGLAFGTPGGLCRIGLDGTKFEEVKQWRTPAATMTAIEKWSPSNP